MNNKFVQKKGKILVLLKMFKEAEIQCDKSIELDSKNPEIFVLKGNLFDFLFENDNSNSFIRILASQTNP